MTITLLAEQTFADSIADLARFTNRIIDRLEPPDTFPREALQQRMLDACWAETQFSMVGHLAGDEETMQVVDEVRTVCENATFFYPLWEEPIPVLGWIERIGPMMWELKRQLPLTNNKLVGQLNGEGPALDAFYAVTDRIYYEVFARFGDLTSNLYFLNWQLATTADGRQRLQVEVDRIQPEQKSVAFDGRSVPAYGCCFAEPLGARRLSWPGEASVAKPVFVADCVLDQIEEYFSAVFYGKSVTSTLHFVLNDSVNISIVGRTRMFSYWESIPYDFRWNFLGKLIVEELPDLFLIHEYEAPQASELREFADACNITCSPSTTDAPEQNHSWRFDIEIVRQFLRMKAGVMQEGDDFETGVEASLAVWLQKLQRNHSQDIDTATLLKTLTSSVRSMTATHVLNQMREWECFRGLFASDEPAGASFPTLQSLRSQTSSESPAADASAPQETETPRKKQRSYTAIEAEIESAVQRVWYDRHSMLRESIAAGKDTCDAEIWAGALRHAEFVEQRHAGKLGPYSDFEWGMLNGKLSALRWVMGADWDDLST